MNLYLFSNLGVLWFGWQSATCLAVARGDPSLERDRAAEVGSGMAAWGSPSQPGGPVWSVAAVVQARSIVAPTASTLS